MQCVINKASVRSCPYKSSLQMILHIFADSPYLPLLRLRASSMYAEEEGESPLRRQPVILTIPLCCIMQ